MSDPGATHAAVAPLRPPPLPQARIDPSPEVQAAISAALRACHSWKPVALPLRPADPGQPAVLPHLPMTVEAAICDTIDDWPRHADQGAYLWLGVGVALGLLAAAVLLLLGRAIRAFGQTSAGFWLRARLRGPWRVLWTSCLGALFGAWLGAALSVGLSKIDLRSAVATEVLCLLGGIGGACGMVWLRRWEYRHEILRWLR